MLFTVPTFSTYLKSLRVKPICRYLDCTLADSVAPWKLSKSCMMLNFTFQSSSLSTACLFPQSPTVSRSFRIFTLSIAVLPSLKHWPSRFVKVVVTVWLSKRTTSFTSPSIWSTLPICPTSMRLQRRWLRSFLESTGYICGLNVDLRSWVWYWLSMTI